MRLMAIQNYVLQSLGRMNKAPTGTNFVSLHSYLSIILFLDLLEVKTRYLQYDIYK